MQLLFVNPSFRLVGHAISFCPCVPCLQAKSNLVRLQPRRLPRQTRVQVQDDPLELRLGPGGEIFKCVTIACVNVPASCHMRNPRSCPLCCRLECRYLEHVSLPGAVFKARLHGSLLRDAVGAKTTLNCPIRGGYHLEFRVAITIYGHYAFLPSYIMIFNVHTD